MTGTAAQAFITTATEIVERTGCTPDQAIAFLIRQMRTERPELLAKVAAGALA